MSHPFWECKIPSMRWEKDNSLWKPP